MSWDARAPDTVSWREARELLTVTGSLSANEAQQVLDDLAWFTWSRKSRSVLAGTEVRWLRYDDSSTTEAPRYLLLKVKP